MSCETRTDSAGREVSACTLAPGGGAVVHAWHSNLAPFPPHSLCRPRLSLSVRPSTRLSYNCGQRSKWQWAMLYPRPLALIRGGFAWMDGPAAAAALLRCSGFWMASPLLPPPHSEPRIITLLEVTPSASAHCGDTPKMRGAPRHIPFTGAITKAASRFIAPSAVSPVRRGHLSLRLSGYRSLIYYRNIINDGLRN